MLICLKISFNPFLWWAGDTSSILDVTKNKPLHIWIYVIMKKGGQGEGEIEEVGCIAISRQP